MKKSFVVFLSLLITTSVQALECQGEACFKEVCALDARGEQHCYISADLATARQALREIKALEQASEDKNDQRLLLTAIGGAAGSIAGAAYASRAAYALQTQETQLLAQTIKKQHKLISHAVQAAFSNEIQFAVNGIANHNAQLVQTGKSMYTSEAVAGHVTEHLKQAEVKGRIMKALEKVLSGANGPKGAKEMAQVIYHHVLRDAGPIIKSKWHENAYFMLKGWSGKINLGQIMTTSIIEKTLPFLAQTSANRLMQIRALASASGIVGRCRAFLGGSGWRAGAALGGVLGSTIFFTMIDAAPVADGTLRGMYSHAPHHLLDASDAEALRMLEQHPSVRNSVVTWHQMIEAAQDAEVVQQ